MQHILVTYYVGTGASKLRIHSQNRINTSITLNIHNKMACSFAQLPSNCKTIISSKTISFNKKQDHVRFFDLSSSLELSAFLSFRLSVTVTAGKTRETKQGERRNGPRNKVNPALCLPQSRGTAGIVDAAKVQLGGSTTVAD